MELQCITLSRELVNVDLSVMAKGFFIQLILLSQYGNMELTKANIINALRIDRKTYDKYIGELLNKLVSYNRNK